MLNLHEILNSLSNQRPIFHSEADFQHSLAWSIHKNFPNAKIRLERPCVGRNGRIYLDVWIRLGDERIGIELKYKTKRLHTTVENEEYKLRNQSAQDIGRYDLLSDLLRMEGLLESNYLDHGFTIFLTNDSGYWSDSGRRNRVDEDFRIREGRLIEGQLAWANHASDGTRRGREEPILISGSYMTSWSQYSMVEENSFKYLLWEANLGSSA
jgi:hypothetical protein